MHVVAIIPARYGSTRFPGKALADIGGKTMIQRVYEGTRAVDGFAEVIVATDDARIEKKVRDFGGQVVMTSADHQSGTERCAEVLQQLPERPDAIVNVQGDVPFIDGEHLQAALGCIAQSGVQIASLVKRITDAGALNNPNTPKVIFDSAMRAIYFSRSPLPHLRDTERDRWLDQFTYYKHIGVYAYRSEVLERIVQLPPGRLELAEQLEQLRWLEHGYPIHLAEVNTDTLSIDTPEDLSRVLAHMEGKKFLAR
jgi:3-deoxy-manno-octulosonate cytidylyltransferase (CMP-KDO synthetase)